MLAFINFIFHTSPVICMKGLVFLACLMLLLAAPAVFAQYGSYDDDWYYDSSSSGCCCGPTFILLAGATLFAYAHQRK